MLMNLKIVVSVSKGWVKIVRPVESDLDQTEWVALLTLSLCFKHLEWNHSWQTLQLARKRLDPSHNLSEHLAQILGIRKKNGCKKVQVGYYSVNMVRWKIVATAVGDFFSYYRNVDQIRHKVKIHVCSILPIQGIATVCSFLANHWSQ